MSFPKEPGWLPRLIQALKSNGLKPHGGNITGVGERHNLANWWFAHPERAAKHTIYGVRMHGVKKWAGFMLQDWRNRRG